MRKKSKKKQIVAMTLALSVLSSSVGMCGASAAEALPDIIQWYKDNGFAFLTVEQAAPLPTT